MPRGTTPFIHKTWELLADRELQSIVTWCRKGESFAILDADTFAKEVLPQYFKHSNMCSFVRQLNTYGFKKVTARDSHEYEFKHKLFHRDHEELLPHIVRRTSPRMESALPPSESSSTSLLQQLVESNTQLAHMLQALEDKQHIAKVELRGMRQELGETRHMVHRLESSYWHRPRPHHPAPYPHHPEVHAMAPPPHPNVSSFEEERKQNKWGGFDSVPITFPLTKEETGCTPGCTETRERPLFSFDMLPLNADLEFGELFDSL